MNFILPTISWIQNKFLVPNIKTLTKWQNIPNIPSSPSFILKVFHTFDWGSQPQRKHPPGRVFFDVPFLYQSHPFGWSRNCPREKYNKNMGVKEWFCWIEFVSFVVKCVKKITSKHKTKNIPNPGNFGQKSYRIPKCWPSLTLETEPLQSPVFQAHYLINLYQNVAKVGSGSIFSGNSWKFHNSWNWSVISCWKFLSKKGQKKRTWYPTLSPSHSSDEANTSPQKEADTSTWPWGGMAAKKAVTTQVAWSGSKQMWI